MVAAPADSEATPVGRRYRHRHYDFGRGGGADSSDTGRGDTGGGTGAAAASGGCGSAPVAAPTASTTAGPTSLNPLLQLTGAPPRGGRDDSDEAAACQCGAGGRPGAGGDTECVGGGAGRGGGTAPAGWGSGVTSPSHRPSGGCSAEPRADPSRDSWKGHFHPRSDLATSGPRQLNPKT